MGESWFFYVHLLTVLTLAVLTQTVSSVCFTISLYESVMLNALGAGEHRIIQHQCFLMAI